MTRYTMTKDEILAELASIEEGSYIEVKWLDACATKNVERLENQTFATYKRTTARFWKIKEDSLYRAKHLILKTRAVGYETYNIISIPIVSIIKIEKLALKMRFKQFKSGTGAPYLTSRKVADIPREEGVGEVDEP